MLRTLSQRNVSALGRQDEVDTLFANLCGEGLSDDDAIAKLYSENQVGLMFLWKTLADARSIERKVAMKQVLEATRSARADTEPNNLAIDAKHCPRCGETLFRAMPGETTRDEIATFIATSKICEGMPKEDPPWIHPGLYCPNGCVQQLWNLAQTGDNKRMESNG